MLQNHDFSDENADALRWTSLVYHLSANEHPFNFGDIFLQRQTPVDQYLMETFYV